MGLIVWLNRNFIASAVQARTRSPEDIALSLAIQHLPCTTSPTLIFTRYAIGNNKAMKRKQRRNSRPRSALHSDSVSWPSILILFCKLCMMNGLDFSALYATNYENRSNNVLRFIWNSSKVCRPTNAKRGPIKILSHTHRSLATRVCALAFHVSRMHIICSDAKQKKMIQCLHVRTSDGR